MKLQVMNMNILAFPYAFGSANIFYDIGRELKKGNKFYAFDYPGHGSRITEDPLTSIEDIVEDIYRQAKKYMNEPYCLLGYSMGGLAVYKLYQKILLENIRLPEHIFILATSDPGRIYNQFDFERYDNDGVRSILVNYGATSEEILENDEIISLVAPCVIADSIILRDFKCNVDDIDEIRCEVTIIRGDKEKDIDGCKERWERYLKRECEFIPVVGNHFFLFNNGQEMVTKISSIISERLLRKVNV